MVVNRHRELFLCHVLADDVVVEELPDEVGVLLDAAGFAQVAEARAALGVTAAGFGVSVELGEDDDGEVQFFGEGFEAAGNFGDFELAVVLGAAGGRAQELQVVDEDRLDVVLRFEAAGFGAEFENGMFALTN